MKKIKICLCSMVFVCIFILSGREALAASSPVGICSGEEWEVLKLVNKERRKAKRPLLSLSSTVQRASGIRAVEISKSFRHIRPNQKSWYTAMNKKKTFYNTCGENIAFGQRSPGQVVKEWMRSPLHRGNILKSGYTHIGVGCHRRKGDNKPYWSQFFLGSCNPQAIKIKKKKINTFPVNTAIEAMNYVLVIKCKHGTSYLPVTADLCSGYKKSQAGPQKIRVAYQGKKAAFTVQIKRSWIHHAQVETIIPRDYNGSLHKPKPVVRLNGKILKEGIDYVLTYRNNLYAGTGQIIITGCGQFQGSISVPFKINNFVRFLCLP